MIPVKEEDITKADVDVIVHQTNCVNAFGGGVAGAIARRYPEVKKAYHKYVSKKLDASTLLGTVQYCDTADGQKVVANVYGQYDIRSVGNPQTEFTQEEKLLQGIQTVETYARKHNYSVAIPYKIGSELGGGNWETIRAGIEAIFKDSPVDVRFSRYTP